MRKMEETPKLRKSPTAKKHPTREEIAVRAYQIYLERSGAPGNELEDWTRAERELLPQETKPRGKVKPISIAA